MGKKIECVNCGKEYDFSEVMWGINYDPFCPYCGSDPLYFPKEYKKASLEDLDVIYEIVQSSIKETYPKYYCQEVVDFFSELHSKKNIEKDIKSGTVGLLLVGGIPVGTGCYQDDHITRVYVAPKEQGNGYGSYIMHELEGIIGPKYGEVYLDASLPACHMYEEREYRTLEHVKQPVANGKMLVYEKMVRQFDPLYFT